MKMMKRILSIVCGVVLSSLCVFPSFFELANASANTDVSGKRFTGTESFEARYIVPTTPLTYETELKITKAELNGTASYVFGNQGNGTNHTGKASGFFSLRINESGNPLFYVFQSASNPKINHYVTFNNVNVATGEKVHLAVTIDNANFYCYVNGELKQTVARKDGTEPVNVDFPVYNKFRIGEDLSDKLGEHFRGELYSVALYKDLRTATEIKSDCDNGVQTSDANILLAYDLTKTQKDPKIIEASTANENHAYDIANLYKWSTTPKYNPDDYSYSIMVVGDTQVVSQYNARDLALGKITEGNTYMDMIYDYIVDSIDDKNVKFVVGLGDVTQFNAKNEWEEAVRVTSKLNNKVPYSIARGNHDLATGTWAGSSYLGNKTNKHEFEPYFIYDYWNGTSGTAAAENANINWNYCNTYYMQYFGSEKNSAYTSQFDYVFEEGNPTNNIQFFTGNDRMEYMVVTLDYGPTDEMLAWASDIISRYPNHNVIVTTHGYMFGEQYYNTQNYYGRRYINSSDSGLSGKYGANKENANDGGEMWDELIKLHPNIKMVLCGHIETEIIEYRKDIGVNGNSVIQMLVDPQGIDAYNRQQPLYVQDSSDKANLLTGMVATYYFSEDGKTVDVEWYSPIQKAYYMEQGQFTFTTESVEYPRVVAKVIGGNGTVSPEKKDFNGQPVTITFTPNEGYVVKKVTLDGEDVSTQVVNNTLVVSDDNGYCEVEVEYIRCSIVASVSGGHGTVSPENIDTNGTPEIITFTPDYGYRISKVTLDGVDVTDQVVDNTLEIIDVNGYRIVVVEYCELEKYNIRINNDKTKGVTILSESISGAYYAGTEMTFEVNAIGDYVVDEVKLNGNVLTADALGKYAIVISETDNVIDVTYREDIVDQFFVLNVINDVGKGMITVDGGSLAKSYKSGTEVSFTIAEKGANAVNTVKFNDAEITAVGGVYTITIQPQDNVLEISYVSVPSTSVKYLLSIINDNSKGSFTSDERIFSQYNCGDEVTFSVSSLSGYQVLQVKFNGSVITAVDSVYTVEITASDNVIEIIYKTETAGGATPAPVSCNAGSLSAMFSLVLLCGLMLMKR